MEPVQGLGLGKLYFKEIEPPSPLAEQLESKPGRLVTDYVNNFSTIDKITSWGDPSW